MRGWRVGLLTVGVLVAVGTPAAAQDAGFLRSAEKASGTDRGEVLRGTTGSDAIFAGGGGDTVYGYRSPDLIRGGLLSVDDRLELQWLKNGPVLKGKVLADGVVMVKTSDGWQQYDSLSTAASRVAGRSLNGWKHWRLVNHDGTTTALEDIRAKYLKEEADG